MFYYNICINNGVEAFGTEGKTITVNEVLQTADIKALAREIHHENMLIPEQVAESVLQNFAKAAVNLMSMGFAIQFKSNDNVVMRIYPDIKLKSGNINLDKAKELMPDVVHNEEEMVEQAGNLVAKVGITVRAHAECERKFTEMLMAESSGIERKDIIEKPRIMKNDEENGSGSDNGGTTPVTPDPGTGGGDTGGDTGGEGGDDNGGGGGNPGSDMD